MKSWMRVNVVALSIAGAVAAALVWFALASATGLIFHFMPAAPSLVAAWIMRADVDGNHRPGRLGAGLVAATLVAVLMTLVLSAQGRPLDEPVPTTLAIVGGLGFGAWLVRPAARNRSGSET